MIPSNGPSPSKIINDDLFYTYSLNEIKSQEDFAKQLLPMNAILISIYIALILNNQSFEAIRVVSNGLQFWRGGSLFIYLIVLLIPIFCWLVSMDYCYNVIKPEISWANSLFDENKSEYVALESITNYKYDSLKNGFRSIMLGLAIVFVIMMIVIGYQLFGNSAILVNTGWELYHEGKLDESILAYDKALLLNPNIASVWNQKAIVLHSMGKYDEAIFAYDKAIALEPNNKIFWHNKATTLENTGKTDAADAAFAEAKKLGYKD